MLYAKPGERLYIHVFNGDSEECHSFYLHGLKYGIDSDCAWPFGVSSTDGSHRSDEILPGQSWTYIFDAIQETVGAWAFMIKLPDRTVFVSGGNTRGEDRISAVLHSIYTVGYNDL